LLAGRTQTTTPDSFGIIIFNAKSDEAAQHIVDNEKRRLPRAAIPLQNRGAFGIHRRFAWLTNLTRPN
jgi:hypothetical protein